VHWRVRRCQSSGSKAWTLPSPHCSWCWPSMHTVCDPTRPDPTRPDPVVAVVAACCTVVAGLVAPGQIAGVGLPWLRRVPSRPTRAREVATC
jgi:hypothetical protein